MLLTGGTDGVFMLRGGGAVFDQLSAGMTNQLEFFFALHTGSGNGNIWI